MTKTAEKVMMHKTRIDIPQADREGLVDLLNHALAHLIHLKLQVKQAHWNVKGMRFIALHELFDMLATELDGHIDKIAERATTLGGVARGQLTSIVKETTLEDYPLDIVRGEEHLEALIERYAIVTKLVRANIEKSEENFGDKDTADLFTEVSRALDLRLWFLEAHIQDKPLH